VVTVLGLVFGILAGLAALGTPIYSFVGAIAHSFTPVSFALFLGVVVAVGLTVLALLPDNLHGFTAGLGLALAWIVIPTLLRQGVVPAPAGPHIQAVLTQLTQPIWLTRGGSGDPLPVLLLAPRTGWLHPTR
jgi:hypothetical protein